MISKQKKYFIFCTLAIVFVLIAVQSICQSNHLSRYLNEKKWNELFPDRFNLSSYGDQAKNRKRKKDFYSFKSFLKAAESFPQFLAGDDTVMQKRELCAFFANIAYETGGGWDDAPGGYYKWGLYYTQELECEKGCPQYTDTTKKNYPPVAGQSYHGRGPLQLSWNYNYGQFSESFLGDKETLLKNPSLVANDPVTCFASAIWFWTTAQFPKPSCHDIIYNNWKPTQKDIDGGRLPGFGTVLNVINGGIECGPKAPAGTKYRYGYYLYFCKYFKVDPGPDVDCSSQKPFGM